MVPGKGCAYLTSLEEELLHAVTVPLSLARAHIRAVLDQWGFAIVPDVLPPSDVAQLEQLWANDLVSIIDTTQSKMRSNVVKRILADPAHNWPIQASLGSKFVTQYGLPQGQMAWGVRAHPHVKEVFEGIYHTNDLCVGLDTVFYRNVAPVEKDSPSNVTELWPHVDQNAHIPVSGKNDVFQSVVYLWKCDKTTSATVIQPRSHTDTYRRIMETTTQCKHHFCKVQGEDMLKEFACNARRVPVPAGGMIVWSSKTSHQGWNWGPRLAVPVSFEPTCRRDNATLENKRAMVATGSPSTHWASICVPHSSARTDPPCRVPGLSLARKAHMHALLDPSTGKLKPEIDKLL